MGNWVKIVNQLEREKMVELQGELLDKAIECNQKIEDANNRLVQAVYATDYELKVFTKYTVEELLKNNKEISNIVNEVGELLNHKAFNKNEFGKDVQIIIDKTIDEALFQIGRIQPIQIRLLEQRLMLFKKRMASYAIQMYMESYNNALENIRETGELLALDSERLRASQTKFEVFEELNNKVIEKAKSIKLKLFSYKELMKEAESLGYEHIRTKGSHYIYNNKKTNKSVPIPCHTLGAGLMIAIQKQLIAGAS